MKIIRRKNVNPPPLCLTIFDTRNWWNTKGFPYEIYRPCETKNFRRKTLFFLTLLSKNIFGTGNFVKRSTNELLYEMFRYCETKKIRLKNVNPPSLMPNNFPYPKLMKHQRIPLRNLSAVWDKKLRKENLDLLHPLIHKLFRYRMFLKTQQMSVSLRNIPAPWDKKTRRKNVNNTSLSTNNSRYRKMMKHKSIPYEMLRFLWDEKNSTEKCKSTSLMPNSFRYPKLMKH